MTAFAQALLAEQTRLHGRVLGQSLGATLVAAALLAVYLHGFMPHGPLLAWVGVLLLAVALRGGVHLLQRRAAAATPQDPRWRRHHRLTALVHGCAWAMGGGVLALAPARWQVEVLVLTLVAVSALSLVMLSFDPVAALLRGVPALLPLLWLMSSRPPPQWPRSLGVAALVLLASAWALRRRWQQLNDELRQRLDQARHTEDLARTVAAFDRAGAIAGVGGWELDAATRGLRLSPQALRLLDLPPPSPLDTAQWLALADAADRAVLQAALDAALAGGQAFSLDLPLRTAAGRAIFVRLSGEARRVDGRIVAVDGALQDLTQQHAAAQALRVDEVVINASAELISVLDEHETYRLVNDAWCRAFGLQREQVLGRHKDDFMPGLVSDERVQALRACLVERRRTQVRDVVQAPGQPPRSLHTDYYPVALGEAQPRLAALVTRDVTQEEAQRAAMVAATETLRGTLEATGEAIYATDSESDDEPARFANARQFALWRLAPELQGRLTNAVVMAHMRPLLRDPDAVFARMDAVVAAGVPVDDLRLSLLDGRHIKLGFACVPVNGRKLRVWSGRDITAEQAAVAAREASAAEQRAMLDNFPGYIAVVDGQDRYLHVNDRLAALMRRPVAEVIGRPVEQVLGEARWRKLRQTLEQARRSGQVVSSAHYPSADGTGVVDLDITHVAGPRHADGTQVVYAFGIDITERKRAQAALIDALAEAERANKAKSQFLSSMSHELRTPLNAVLGFGQLLAQEALSPAQQHQVVEILRGGRHLLGLINDLLDLGRIEAGELEVVCEAVDAPAAIDECLGLMEPLAREHGVSLHHHRAEAASTVGPTLRADPKRLRQVLLNLLSNAVKYNQAGGQVIVDTGLHDGCVELRVRDTGPGLSVDEQQRLFRPFERLQAHRGAVDGTGIGLALSRHLVEAMDGRIGIASQPGQGSTFWVRLPRADAPAPAAAPPDAGAATAAPARRPRAIYIEDNPVNAMLMAAMLEDEVELVTEGDPLRGLAQVQALQPDLVLLDIQLPGIDGYEVLRRLRADDRTRTIPVVAVSANAMRADVAAGHAAGFDAYLTKPIDLGHLLDTVRRIGGRAHHGPGR